MKHVPFVAALLVLVGLALAFALGRPEPPDDSLFGPQMALAPVLEPLVAPGGSLRLRGNVHHAGGAPAADALVALVRAEDDPARTEPLYHIHTDAAGRFEFARLAPGRYTVVLVHPSAPPRTFPLELPLAAADGLNGDAVASAVRWELAPPLAPLDMLPELARGALEGRVVLPAALSEETPDLAGFEIVLAPAKGTPPLAGAAERRIGTDAEGRFALDGVVAAAYRVEVLPPWARGGSWPVLARGTAEIAADGRAAIELALEVGALTGELAEANGRPLVGALVSIAALDALDAVGEPQLWPPATSDEAGRWRVALLPPGRYGVHLRAGAAAADSEARVESGAVTRVPAARLDVRGGGVVPGG
jgi:hypothetical protein